MDVVKYKDPCDGSIRIIKGRIIEKRVEGITIDDGKDYIMLHRRNILEIFF